MPAAVLTAILPAAIGAGATVGTAYFASRAQSKAADRAAAASSESTSEAVALERELEENRREEWEATERENRRQHDLAVLRDRQDWLEDLRSRRYGEASDTEIYNAEQRRRQPYRDISISAARSLASQAGLRITPTKAHQLPPAPPAPTMADLIGVPSASSAR